MAKSPDEIKRNIVTCMELNMEHFMPGATQKALGDALALIQQLQAQNAEQAEKIKKLENSLSFAWELGDGLKADNIKLEQEIDALKHRTKQLEAERDEAVEDLETVCVMFSVCHACKDRFFGGERCRGCLSSNHWEWRGVQKEGTK